MLEVGEAEAQLLRLVAAQVRDEGVRDADEILEDAARLGMPQVERDERLFRLKLSKKSESVPSW